MNMGNDLSKRLFEFAVRTIKFLRRLPATPEYGIIKTQLTKAATSAGANYEESQAGISRKDFHNKIIISLKEMRESNYWYRIIKVIYEKNGNELSELLNESEELMKILGRISKKTLNK